jgi:hypothetical protein
VDLRAITAATPEVLLQGTVLCLVQQQGINSLDSLMDNLPQTAFNTTGLADAGEHWRLGYLASPFDHADLTTGISWLLARP